MQDGKENSTGFVKNIWNTVHDWWVSYDRKLWTTRIFVYGFLLLLVVLVGAIIFTHFNLFHTEPNSARYMLSALVQSQAAIVAIVITLTLIAVQLTASAYSPRVIDIFKKNPDMWLLLGCYGVSIFFGFIVLKLVEGAEGENVSQSVIWSLGSVSVSFESCVSLAYWLGAFTFVALFPYMWNIIGLLKPENIIKRLAVEITKDNILNSKEDPFQPIMDIVRGSIMKYDLATTRGGLWAVTDSAIEIIVSHDEDVISWSFCKDLRRVSRLTVNKLDEESTSEVIINLGRFGMTTAAKGLEDATWSTVRRLGVVERTAAEKGLVCASLSAISWLGDVGRTAAEKGLERATLLAVWMLGVAGRTAVEKEREDAIKRAVWSLEEIGRTVMDKECEDAIKRAVWSLEEIGRRAMDKECEDASQRAAKSLAELTLLSEEIVETAIQNYESNLEEKDHDSFRKFMEIYKQKLEERRAEKR